jgi:hypothetical protein
MSGHPGSSDDLHENYIPEVFEWAPKPQGQWHRLGSFSNQADVDTFSISLRSSLYPRLHLLPTGDVFCSSPFPHAPKGMTYALSVNSSNWSGRFHQVDFEMNLGQFCSNASLQAAPTPDSADRGRFGLYATAKATSVLLPLLHEKNYQARVLICGDERPAIMDLTGWDPAKVPVPGQYRWRPTRGRRELQGSPIRMNLNAVLLPTGEVLVCGGVSGKLVIDKEGNNVLLEVEDEQPGDRHYAVLTPEVFHPDTESWEALPDPAKVVRNYHSVALLMPDGRVWTAGSDKDAGQYAPPHQTPSGGPPAAVLKIEIYQPWYYGDPRRPHIIAAPDHFYPGDKALVLRSTRADEVIRVAMVRCGSCTHAFNPDQRYISVPFRYQGSDIIGFDAPPPTMSRRPDTTSYTPSHEIVSHPGEPPSISTTIRGTAILIAEELGPARQPPAQTHRDGCPVQKVERGSRRQPR